MTNEIFMSFDEIFICEMKKFQTMMENISHMPHERKKNESDLLNQSPKIDFSAEKKRNIHKRYLRNLLFRKISYNYKKNFCHQNLELERKTGR